MITNETQATTATVGLLSPANKREILIMKQWHKWIILALTLWLMPSMEIWQALDYQNIKLWEGEGQVKVILV